MDITHKDWVCLVDAETLARSRKRARETWHSYLGIREQLWRQIEFRLNAEQIVLDLGSVNEEAAAGGYWNGSWDCRTYRFTWADLDDKQFLKNIVAREQFVVAERVLQMLEALRVQRLVFKRALTAPFDNSASADLHVAAA